MTLGREQCAPSLGFQLQALSRLTGSLNHSCSTLQSFGALLWPLRKQQGQYRANFSWNRGLSHWEATGLFLSSAQLDHINASAGKFLWSGWYIFS